RGLHFNLTPCWVGPGCGWSGFIATSAALGAPFTLASERETLRRTEQGAFNLEWRIWNLEWTRIPNSEFQILNYDVFLSCASSAFRIFAYWPPAPLTAFM